MSYMSDPIGICAPVVLLLKRNRLSNVGELWRIRTDLMQMGAGHAMVARVIAGHGIAKVWCTDE